MNKIGVISLPIDRLHIEVTNYCNFSCEFCPDSKMERQRGFMNLEMLKGILDEVAEKGISKLVLLHIMGEPLIYPRLLDAIDYASSKGISTCVTTNGSLLTEELLDNMIKVGVSRIILSLQTPDEESFSLRGAKRISFNEYRETVRRIARKVINEKSVHLTISFLSSPLRTLRFPIMPEISIADTSTDLRWYLLKWSEYILTGTYYENNLNGIHKRLRRVRSFRENCISLCQNLTFETRIMGDWAFHSFNNGVKAKIGFCPGIQENLGILWKGDIVFCCVDYEGRTALDNIKNTSIYEYLISSQVQEVVKGFKRLRVVHPHCQRCLGDKDFLHAFVRQIGSILYFKAYKRFF